MYSYINYLILFFQVIILLYFFTTNIIYTLFAILSLKSTYEYAYIASRVKIRRILSDTFYKPISIIVPAYNEQETIIASITSLSHLHYPEFEIIVVNDGSRDQTLDRLIEEFQLIKVDKPIKIITDHKPVKDIFVSNRLNNLIVINKDNGGKSDALNAGINVSKYPIFLTIDADSLLENDSLLRGVSLFIEDQEVVAAGGVVKILNGCKTVEGIVTEIRNPKSCIENFQSIEYTRGFLSGRTAWNSLNHSLMVISGAFGLFRKDLVLEIKGYRHTPGEDMDLVVRLHKHCRDKKMRYKVVSLPVPVCFTQAPSDLVSLIKQRNRWHRGLIDSLIYSREMFLNPKYGMTGLFTFPYFVFIEALGPLIEFVGYVSVVLFYLLGYLSFEFAILFFIISVLWALLITLASLLLDSMLSRKNFNISNIIFLCIFAFLENLGYRQLLILERLFATFQFSRKKWGEIKRQNISVSKYSEIYGEKSPAKMPEPEPPKNQSRKPREY